MNNSRSSARQDGVVLVTTLLFLLVVTIISITAANNSSLGLKMSANMQDAYRSFQAAEAGIGPADLVMVCNQAAADSEAFWTNAGLSSLLLEIKRCLAG